MSIIIDIDYLATPSAGIGNFMTRFDGFRFANPNLRFAWEAYAPDLDTQDDSHGSRHSQSYTFAIEFEEEEGYDIFISFMSEFLPHNSWDLLIPV